MSVQKNKSLTEILLAYGMDGTLKTAEAHSVIVDLFKGLVPDDVNEKNSDCPPHYYKEGWNAFREIILSKIESLR